MYNKIYIQTTKENIKVIINLFFLVLCLNTNIPIIPPKLPPNNEIVRRVFSLILLFFLTAKLLSSPIKINKRTLLKQTKYKIV